MSEIDFFNSDGSINFRNMDDTRRSFETNFSKKYLGSVMKNLVANCVFDKNVKEGLKNNEGLKLYLNNAVNQIAENAFDERDSNRNTFTGAMTETVEKYSSMEGNYRYEKALFVANGKESKEYKNKKINTIFSAENFLSDEIEKQFKDEFSFKHGYEAEELVIEVGKEIGEMISEAETKQIVIEQTMSAIADEKENIRKELGVDEEKDEETETSEGDDNNETPEEGGDESDGEIDENGDTTDDSDESVDDDTEGDDDTESEELGDDSDDDEPDTEDEDQSESEESYNYSMEGMSEAEYKKLSQLIASQKDKYIKKAREIIFKCADNMEKIKDNDEMKDIVLGNFVKEDKEYADNISRDIEDLFKRISKKGVFEAEGINFPLFKFKGSSKLKRLAHIIFSGTPINELELLDEDNISVNSGFNIIKKEKILKHMSPYFDLKNKCVYVGLAIWFDKKKILKEGRNYI